MVRKQFGKTVRILREERGITQEKFAELADIDRTYVYRLETGQRSPSLEVIFRIASALKITPGQLLDKIGKLGKSAND
jgi:transcriptional regulator with XRE-family HTH domain